MKQEAFSVYDTLKLALEALENHSGNYKLSKAECVKHEAVVEAIKEALSAERVAQPEPIAKPKLIGWRTANFLWETNDIEKAKNWEPHHEILPIFEGDRDTQLTTPPQRKPWVSLSEEEVDDAARYCVKSGQSVNAAIRAIEDKLRELNS